MTDFTDLLTNIAPTHIGLLQTVTLTYVPVSGSSRTLIAAHLKNRTDDGKVPTMGRTRGPVVEVTVENNVTSGIATTELASGDKVTVEPRVGETAVSYTISRILRQSAGMVTYEAY